MSDIIRCWDCNRIIEPKKESYGVLDDEDAICIDCMDTDNLGEDVDERG